MYGHKESSVNFATDFHLNHVEHAIENTEVEITFRLLHFGMKRTFWIHVQHGGKEGRKCEVLMNDFMGFYCHTHTQQKQ